jgi:hypothetical protein
MPLIYYVVLLFAWGCAIGEQGRLISQDEVTWIQKGVTTRSQVVERFGSPRLETALQSTTTSTTTTTGSVEGHSQTTTTTVQATEAQKGSKAAYLYTRSESTLPFWGNVHTTQFWVVYDEKGIVQDYGFIGVPVTALSPTPG